MYRLYKVSATFGIYLIISYVDNVNDNTKFSLFNSSDSKNLDTVTVTNRYSIYDGILFSVILLAVELIRSFFYSLFFTISYRLGIRLRSGKTGLELPD